MKLSEFYDKLANHDWFYAFSDDGRVYNNGHGAEGKLKTIASTSEAHQALYNSYHDHVFSVMKSVKLPKPERPND